MKKNGELVADEEFSFVIKLINRVKDKYDNMENILDLVDDLYSKESNKLSDEEKYYFVDNIRKMMELKGETPKYILNFLFKYMMILEHKRYEILADISDIYNYDLGDYKAALKYNEEALLVIGNEDNIKKGDIILSIGLIYKKLNNTNLSNKHLEQSKSIFINRKDKESQEYLEIIYRSLADNFAELKNFNKSIDYLKMAMKCSERADTDFGKYLFLIADKYEDLKLLDKALIYSLDAANKIKEETYIRLNYGLIARIYFELKEYNKAITYYSKIIEQFSSHEEIHDTFFRIGKAHYKSGHFLKSIHFFKDAIERLNNNLSDYSELYIRYNSWIARSLYQNNEYDNAIDLCKEMIQKYENNLSILYPMWIMADSYMEKGMNVDAKNTIEKAIELYKDSKQTKQIDKIHFKNVEEVKKEVYKELGLTD